MSSQPCMFLEYDWTFSVYRPRFNSIWIDVRGERSWPTLGEAKEALRAAGFRVGRKTDSRVWVIELVTPAEGAAA